MNQILPSGRIELSGAPCSGPASPWLDLRRFGGRSFPLCPCCPPPSLGPAAHSSCSRTVLLIICPPLATAVFSSPCSSESGRILKGHTRPCPACPKMLDCSISTADCSSRHFSGCEGKAFSPLLLTLSASFHPRRSRRPSGDFRKSWLPGDATVFCFSYFPCLCWLVPDTPLTH